MQTRSKRNLPAQQTSIGSKYLNLSLNEANPRLPKPPFKQDAPLDISKVNKKLGKSMKIRTVAHLDSQSTEPESSALPALHHSIDFTQQKKTSAITILKSFAKAPKRACRSKDTLSHGTALTKNIKCEQKINDISKPQEIPIDECFTKQLTDHYLLKNIDGVFLIDQKMVFSVIFWHNQTPTLKRVTCSKQDLQWLEEADRQEYVLPFFLRMLHRHRK